MISASPEPAMRNRRQVDTVGVLEEKGALA
jgi:hypothetical protein